MGTQFWWIFDVLVLAIAAHAIYYCAKNGLRKVFFICMGYLAATIFSSLLGLATGRVVYEELGRVNDIHAIENANRKVDFPHAFAEWANAQEYGFTVEESVITSLLIAPDTEQFPEHFYNYLNKRNGLDTPVEPWELFQEHLQSVFMKTYSEALGSEMPKYARIHFEEKVQADSSLMVKMLTVFYDPHNTDTAIAEYVESTFTAQPAAEVMRILSYLLYFAVIMIVALLLMQATKNALLFNVTNTTDHVVGGFLGILDAGAMLILFTLVIRLAVLLGGGELLCLNDETIAQSKIFVYLYQNLRLLI